MSKAQKSLYEARLLFIAAQKFEAIEKFKAIERYEAEKKFFVESQVLAQMAFVNHMLEFEAREQFAGQYQAEQQATVDLFRSGD
jgi:hypothetical protein